MSSLSAGQWKDTFGTDRERSFNTSFNAVVSPISYRTHFFMVESDGSRYYASRCLAVRSFALLCLTLSGQGKRVRPNKTRRTVLVSSVVQVYISNHIPHDANVEDSCVKRDVAGLGYPGSAVSMSRGHTLDSQSAMWATPMTKGCVGEP